jgi:hypothetical protein
MRRLADAGAGSVALQSRTMAANDSARAKMANQQAQSVGLQQHALQHQRSMDFEKLALGVSDRLKENDEDDGDAEVDENEDDE